MGQVTLGGRRPVGSRARRGLLVGLLVAALAGCAAPPATSGSPPAGYAFPPAPAAPSGPLAPAAADGFARIVAELPSGTLSTTDLDVLAAAGDSRAAWLVADLMRLLGGGAQDEQLVAAFRLLTGVDPAPDPTFADSPWQSVTNHLIAWDLPAAPGYREQKGSLFGLVEPRWAPFFADADAAIDWRQVSWGGVFIDDRALGDRNPCPQGCIPALDDPPFTDAATGSWYPDARPVFGVVLDGQAIALPRNIMEVHEMVNLTLAGRRLGIPYCTLCGSAQAYLTDAVPAGVEVPVLRTSGLLSRSNKVMYDLRTRSVFDTFTGRALSGPLQDAAVTLPQVTVEVSTWGRWKQAHPDTRILAEDGGLGRSYPLDPLRGRDDDGPIFPIGDADPRLPVQAKVLGVINPDGRAVAFSVVDAQAALAANRPVGAAGVEVFSDGAGLRARAGGAEVAAHEAFWFAWSQFHPDTTLWPP
ncbi:MAG: DUF3179 domain-containing (seleno)protein [Pseudonocardia sp.]